MLDALPASLSKLLSLPAWNCTPHITKVHASPGAWCPIMHVFLPTHRASWGRPTRSSVQLPLRQ